MDPKGNIIHVEDEETRSLHRQVMEALGGQIANLPKDAVTETLKSGNMPLTDKEAIECAGMNRKQRRAFWAKRRRELRRLAKRAG